MWGDARLLALLYAFYLLLRPIPYDSKKSLFLCYKNPISPHWPWGKRWKLQWPSVKSNWESLLFNGSFKLLFTTDLRNLLISGCCRKKHYVVHICEVFFIPRVFLKLHIHNKKAISWTCIINNYFLQICISTFGWKKIWMLKVYFISFSSNFVYNFRQSSIK